jgi:hypothetical protein
LRVIDVGSPEPVWNIRIVRKSRWPVPEKSPNMSTTRGEPSIRAVL